MIDTIVFGLGLIGIGLFLYLVYRILSDSKRTAVRRTLLMRYDEHDVDRMMSELDVDEIYDIMVLLDENDVSVGEYWDYWDGYD